MSQEQLPPSGSATPTPNPALSNRQVVAVLGAAAVLGLLVVGVWAFFNTAPEEEELPLTPADHAVLPTIALVTGGRHRPGRETRRKIRFGEAYRLEYDFEADDAAVAEADDPVKQALINELNRDRLPVKMTASVECKATEDDARREYSLLIGLWLTPTRQKEPSLVNCGDQSHCVWFRDGGQKQGNFFICRVGRKVVMAVTYGTWFESQAAAAACFEPLVAKLKAYQPE